jgi:hypothetical protein
MVRSCISARSNFARAPNTCSTNLLAALVVSICSASERSPTPRPVSSSDSDPPSRSSPHRQIETCFRDTKPAGQDPPTPSSRKRSIRVATPGVRDLHAELQTKELSLPQPWYLSDPGRWRGRSLPSASPRIAAFSCRCTWRSSTVRWCTSCIMLVQAAAASCWVVVSSTVAAVPASLSARRDSERASRRSAVIAFVDGGSGLFMSLSAMLLILRAHNRFTIESSHDICAVRGSTYGTLDLGALTPKRPTA